MPTLRQQKAVQLISENIRNKGLGAISSLGSLLTEAGYSKSVAKKPKLVTQSEGFKDLLDKEVNRFDQLIKLQHLHLIQQSDNLSVSAKAIDMYYKLSGQYDNEKTQDEMRPFRDLSEEELDRMIDEETNDLT